MLRSGRCFTDVFQYIPDSDPANPERLAGVVASLRVAEPALFVCSSLGHETLKLGSFHVHVDVERSNGLAGDFRDRGDAVPRQGPGRLVQT